MVLLFSFMMIILLCLLSISAIIYTDVYNILKLKSIKDIDIDIDMVKFEKCILPTEINS